ncbi:MAG: tripartite tricarboxylate transporter permease, partial [Natrialbaceae archaeon]
VEVVVAPETTVQILAWTLGGVVLGTVSGLIPGIHANNFALVLAGVAPAVPGSSLSVGVAMLAAGVVHTFLNAVPAMALGVPDADTAVTALPGHRLVAAGRGGEAIRLSALGSLLAVLFAVPLALPVTWGVRKLYPSLQAHLSLVLAAVVLGLVLSEPTWGRRLGGSISFALATALGVLTLDVDPSAPLDAGGVLAPLFAGLFGAPVLIDAIGSAGIPPQADAVIAQSRRAVGEAAGAGALAGAVVGYIPGVSSAIAATFALLALDTTDRGGEREFVVAASAVNTSNAIFAIFALYALSDARTGILVAVEQIGAPQAIPIWLAAVAIAAVAGALLVLVVGDRYLAAVGRLDPTWLSIGVLGLLVVLSVVFAGPVGIAVFAASTLIGTIPVRFGARRANCMGVLLVPLAL